MKNSNFESKINNENDKKSQEALILIPTLLLTMCSIFQIINFKDNILQIICLIITLISVNILLICYLITKNSNKKDIKSKSIFLLLLTLLLTVLSILQIINFKDNILQVLTLTGTIIPATIFAISYFLAKKSHKK
jgi:membrane-associated HD superfamily phosphohydrolase